MSRSKEEKVRDGITYEKIPVDADTSAAFEEVMQDRGETARERAVALLDAIHATAKRLGATLVQVGELRFDGPDETGAARTEAVYLQ